MELSFCVFRRINEMLANRFRKKCIVFEPSQRICYRTSVLVSVNLRVIKFIILYY